MIEPEISIEIPARAEAIGEVRDEVGRYAERIGMPSRRVGDLKTIVGEALNNAVIHAYGEEGGVVTVVVGRAACEELEVVVTDFGSGIFPDPDSETPSLKMGLPIIGALSESFRLESKRGHGTVLSAMVAMR